MRLIVGLGNPGERYADTRHNAGALFLDYLALRRGVLFSPERKLQGQIAVLPVSQLTEAAFLLKPLTYMNRSGASVGAAQRFYKMQMSQVLVVQDDLDLAFGEVRLKHGGGHGGHNGLRDIMECVGAQDFFRLRLGIGRPQLKSAVSGYVLESFSKAECLQIEKAFVRAEACIVEWLRPSAG